LRKATQGTRAFGTKLLIIPQTLNMYEVNWLYISEYGAVV